MIEIKNLNKYYGTKQVLKDINLDFKNGKIYGIVGENGSGKTTLFRCIAGLEKFEGKILSEFEALKDHIGLLMAEPFFFSKITGKEYIRLLCNARNDIVENIDDKNVFDLPLHQYASTYSTGMKKKLALTAILLQQNSYYIFDEPFNGIDIQGNVIITEILHTLKTLGKTIIMSSHIFSTLSDTCDEINLIKNGELLKKVHKQNFADLEYEMKQSIIGNKIKRLGLK